MQFQSDLSDSTSVFRASHLALRAAIVLLPVASWLPAAEITGTIRITHKLTKQKVALGANLYSRGVAVGLDKPTEADLQTSELNRTVVYLEGDSLPAAAPRRVTLEQRNRRFEPEIVMVPVGSAVNFPNEDPIFHNVFSLSKAKSFDLGNYSQNQTRTVTFDKAGVAPVYCHLHPNMSAAIVVTPNGFAARPGPDGHFSLRDVPAGQYRVTVWHKSAGYFHGVADVRTSGRVDLNFVIPIRETVTQGAAQP